jgi:hypothetical protein
MTEHDILQTFLIVRVPGISIFVMVKVRCCPALIVPVACSDPEAV